MPALVSCITMQPWAKDEPFAGLSAFHLTCPEDPFLNGGEKERMPVRYSAHGGAMFNISEGLSITPNLLYMRQGDAPEKMVGALRKAVSMKKPIFLLGANYRFKDAMVPYAGVYYKNFVLGVSW